ncbi:unnamed protein product [Ilex paraguariensis]|uniref:Uncharacterized protein n=1 Tax=Ilex paraguariensis TaxID=185542 RepID=A0ABC8TE03_9AQUA
MGISVLTYALVSTQCLSASNLLAAPITTSSVVHSSSGTPIALQQCPSVANSALAVPNQLPSIVASPPSPANPVSGLAIMPSVAMPFVLVSSLFGAKLYLGSPKLLRHHLCP